jgi:hypothetical protein
LPARFATGFAAGSWSAPDRQWVITEAEAHSWPEVYFPEVGWVAFEPTAAQPVPQRIGQPAVVGDAATASGFEPLAPEADADTRVAWVFMLVVLAAVGTFVLVQRMRRRDDPWQAVLAWGGRAGAPLGEGETPLEYGARLAAMVQVSAAGRDPELARIIGRELQELSNDVSGVQYAPSASRDKHLLRVQERWGRLRLYLKQVKLRQ